MRHFTNRIAQPLSAINFIFQQTIIRHSLFFLLACFVFSASLQAQVKKPSSMKLNDLEYLEYQGVNVMLAHDFYPESHQGGVGIIQNGLRVATNGDLRLEPTPGQWQPTPKVGKRIINAAEQQITCF